MFTMTVLHRTTSSGEGREEEVEEEAEEEDGAAELIMTSIGETRKKSPSKKEDSRCEDCEVRLSHRR